MLFKNVVSNISKDTDNFWIIFGDFLDSLKLMSKEELSTVFIDEPEAYDNISEEDIAFLGASANKLCNDYGVDTPMWVFKKKYFLDKPKFAMDAKGDLRIILLQESPSEFRMRNIFTTSNVLNRV